MNTVTNPPQRHPKWCSLELCTAAEVGGAHRSEQATFSAPAVAVELALFKLEPGWDTEVFVTAVVSDSLSGTHHAGVTLSVADGWRLSDVLTELLDRVR